MLTRAAQRVLIPAFALPLVNFVGSAQTVDPAYSGRYVATNLGPVMNVPQQYGGLTFKDNNTLLIGGAANAANGVIFQANVIRDATGHITGFGPATLFARAPNIDGGLTYGPGGVLFYTGYNNNILGEIKPGSLAADKIVNLSLLFVASSVGSVAFVPSGFPGAGTMKLLSYSANKVYNAALSADGSGTYDVGEATLTATLSGGLEGLAFVPVGSLLFPSFSALVSEFQGNRISAYTLDAGGSPIPASRQTFVANLQGAEGAVIDPVTNDFLFSTFGGGNRVVRVSGFGTAVNPVPEPASVLLMATGLAGVIGGYRRRKRASS